MAGPLTLSTAAGQDGGGGRGSGGKKMFPEYGKHPIFSQEGGPADQASRQAERSQA